MNYLEIIERFRDWHRHAVEEKDQEATWHVPIVDAMPLIEHLLTFAPSGWDLL